jgi:hypothetical protein
MSDKKQLSDKKKDFVSGCKSFTLGNTTYSTGLFVNKDIASGNIGVKHNLTDKTYLYGNASHTRMSNDYCNSFTGGIGYNINSNVSVYADHTRNTFGKSIGSIGFNCNF